MGIQERKEREKKLRREAILNAAKELFFTKGFNATTMEDIAEKGELSVATLYSYFKNKEELYASLNMLTLEVLNDMMRKVYEDTSLTVEDKLLGIKEAFYRAFKNDPMSLLNIFRINLEGTLATFSPEVLAEANTLSRKITTAIADIYAEGVQDGVFEQGIGMQHADIIFALVSGLVLWEESKTRLDPRKDFLKPTLDRAFNILISGIKRR